MDVDQQKSAAAEEEEEDDFSDEEVIKTVKQFFLREIDNLRILSAIFL